MEREAQTGQGSPAGTARWHAVLWIAAIALIYFVVARLSLLIDFDPGEIAAIWPASGIFLSALLLTRRELRPWLAAALFLADFIAEILAGAPVGIGMVYALALTTEAVLSAWLLLRFVGGEITFSRIREITGWLVLSVLFSNMLASLLAAAGSLLLPGTSFWSSWTRWAASDGAGNLIVTPLVLSWAFYARTRVKGWRPRRLLEVAILFIPLTILSIIAFSHLSDYGPFSVLLIYLIFPFLLWAAMRFGMRGVSTAALIVSIITVYFAYSGQFANILFLDSVLDVIILAQLYLAVLTIPALILAAVMSERKQVVEALSISEEKFRMLIENSHDAFTLLAADGTVQYDSASVMHILGYNASERIGRKVFEFVPAEEREDMRLGFAKFAQQNGVVAASQQRFIHKDGSLRHIDGIRTNLLNEPAVHAVVVNYRDVTERKQMETRLEEEGSLLRTLIDNLPDRIYAMDVKGRKTLANIADWQASGGKTMEDIIGKTDMETYPPELAEEYWQRDKAVIDSGVPSLNREEPGLDPQGNPVWLLTSKVPLRDGQGNVTGLVGIGRDITERKQAEEEIRKLNVELENRVEERTRQLREAQEQLVRKEKLATLGQLAGGVGHELRNPLGVINNSIYYLKMVQPDANEKVKRHLDIIEQEIHNSEKIINDLLDFGRVVPADKEKVTVEKLVRSTLERFHVPSGIELKLELAGDLQEVYADPRQMEQVLGNLMTNACQAMVSQSSTTNVASQKSTGTMSQSSTTSLPKGGTLTISAERQGGVVSIAVKDTGTGISAENMKKIFEPLFTTKAKGIGLGLAVSRKLAEANGGWIEVESEEGKGSTFTLVLKVVEKLAS